MKTCETCMFYRAFGKNDLGNTIEVFNHVVDEDGDTVVSHVATGTCHIRSVPGHVFPMRHREMFCGEHKSKRSRNDRT